MYISSARESVMRLVASHAGRPLGPTCYLCNCTIQWNLMYGEFDDVLFFLFLSSFRTSFAPGGPGAKDSANCPFKMYLVCVGSF